jgi:hypothetical protein
LDAASYFLLMLSIASAEAAITMVDPMMTLLPDGIVFPTFLELD